MAADYTAISVTAAGRDAARRMAAAMTGNTGQRVNMSDALRIAERIVHAHQSEIEAVAVALGVTSASTSEGTEQ